MRQVFTSQKGAPTVEYVVILAAGVLFAGILVSVMNSEPVKEELAQTIDCHIQSIGDEELDPECNGKNEISQASAPKAKQKGKQDTEEDEGFFSSLWEDVKDAGSDIAEGAENFWEDTKEVASEVWGGTKEVASDVWEWAKENKEYIFAGLTIVAGVALIVSGVGVGLGAAILIGAAVGGGITYFTGGDAKDIARDMAFGGITGIIGGGIGAVASRGAMAAATRFGTSAIGRKLIPGLAGGLAGGGTESLADDALRGKEFDWKKAVISAATAGGVLLGAFGGSQILGAVDEFGPMAGQKLAKEADEATVATAKPKIETYTKTEKGKTRRYMKSTDGREIKLRNGHLAGQTHPKTGVPFDKNGFPDFNEWKVGSDVRIDNSLYLADDKTQFKEATKQLKEQIKKNPDLKKQFTAEQLEAIQKVKDKIPKYTWHHNQEEGILQLIPYSVHSRTGHTGGRDIWGGGNSYR
ncbi:DUF4244 domain-containing protein [Mechercharimyces sp. CAU 1602]|uniref:DUF4244 domain-containing protein n=1 Tax=Mechercharimyces sp. CAU 1602 TaxID=2973933 RepID=UPI002162CFC0|nr:DUF4244 domain-containing protein [Mechercharimyces sp. CAU 1602]